MPTTVKDPPTNVTASPSSSLMLTSPALSAVSSLSSSAFEFVNVKQQLDSERLVGAGAGAISKASLETTAGEESSFSDDEIVWTVSESEDPNGAVVLSDDDFVVLTRSSIQGSMTKRADEDNVTIHGTPHILDPGLEPEDRDTVSLELAKEVARLNIDPDGGLVGEASGTKTPDFAGIDSTGSSPPETAANKGRKKKKKSEEQKAPKKRVTAEGKGRDTTAKELNRDEVVVSTDSIAPVLTKSLSEATIVPYTPQLPATPPAPTSPKKKKRVKVKRDKAAIASPVVHSAPVSSEKVSEQPHNPTPYDEAVTYITSYIANPSAHTNQICHLTLLQSFIIELGLLNDVKLLPTTIKSAKKYIKSRVFLNIRDYLSKRLEGPQAVRDLLFSSRWALVRDMRRKKNHASLKWVKKRGLQDLLVSVFH